MAIKILWGPGGSGKSYYQVRQVVEELRTTRRNIVTNLSLDPGRLGEWLETHYPDEKIRLNERLRFLSPAESREFWKYRGPIRWTGREYEMEQDSGAFGVAYFIDEAGACGFGAKEWNGEAGRSSRGVACGAYLDQQRKFNDNVYFSTNGRTPSMIAKDIRDRGHEFIKLRNGYLKSYGPFRARGRFTATIYATEPSNSTEPIRSEHWGLDTSGLASCYRTEEGVGVVGSTADKGARAKGIPILWAIPMWVAIVSLIFLLPWLFSRFFVSKARASSEALVSSVTEVVHEARPYSAPLSSPAPLPPGIACVGYSVLGGNVIVHLSDGTRLTDADPELESIERNRVRVSGRWIPIKLRGIVPLAPEMENPPAYGPGGS